VRKGSGVKVDLKAYYTELGVQPDADASAIREAYRRLAKKYHPDTNRGDKKAEERFKRITAAYRVLSDPAQRLAYHGKEEIRQKAKRASRGVPTSSFSDLFKQVFQSGFSVEDAGESRKRPQRGRPLRATIDLNPVEMATGATKTLQLKLDVPCKVCNGTGNQQGLGKDICPACHGLGEKPTVVKGRTVFSKCLTCGGSGRSRVDSCTVCGGTSLQHAVRDVKVSIPAGVSSGRRITLKGQGHAGAFGGEAGELVLEVRQVEHASLQVAGFDLKYTLPITVKEALAGGEVEAPGRTGQISLKLKPGNTNGRLLRVKNQGLPLPKGGYGDLLVNLQIHIPEKTSENALRLLDQLMREPGWHIERKASGK